MDLKQGLELEKLKLAEATRLRGKEFEDKASDINRTIDRRSGAWHAAHTKLKFDRIAAGVEDLLRIREDLIGRSPEMANPHQFKALERQIHSMIEQQFRQTMNSFHVEGIRAPSSATSEAHWATLHALKARTSQRLRIIQLEAQGPRKMYNEALAKRILEKLDEQFPDKMTITQLSSILPEFSSLTREDWFTAVNALHKDGLVECQMLFSGTGAIDDIGPMAITPSARGKSWISGSAMREKLDPLLRILDRGEFDRDISEALKQANPARPLSALFIDLDDFKAVNDNFGHEIGDKVLRAIATSIRAACESKGRCYRYGGEEITVLLPNHDLSEAVSLARRILSDVARVRVENGPPGVTVSIGAACYPETTTTGVNLIQDADAAMYQAKRDGKNRVEAAPTHSAIPAANENRNPKRVVIAPVSRTQSSDEFTLIGRDQYGIVIETASGLMVRIPKQDFLESWDDSKGLLKLMLMRKYLHGYFPGQEGAEEFYLPR